MTDMDLVSLEGKLSDKVNTLKRKALKIGSNYGKETDEELPPIIVKDYGKHLPEEEAKELDELEREIKDIVFKIKEHIENKEL